MHHHLIVMKELCSVNPTIYPDLVSFPVLGRIKPQIPLLVVPFRQFF